MKKKNIMSLSVFALFTLAAFTSYKTLMFSCNKSGTTDKNTSIIDSLEISSKYIQPVDSIQFLQSYNLSCSYPCGDSLAIMGYNYRTHALDIFSDSTLLNKIQLEHHGENGILGRPTAIMPITRDSIWIYDQVAFYLIDSQGKLLYKFKEGRSVFLNANYAMQTAVMGWYDNDCLLYPVDVNGRYFVEYYSLKQKKIVKEVELDGAVCNRNGKNSYGYMTYPNVSFANNKIIYNYPYESNIQTIELSTGEKQEYKAESKFTDNTINPYKGSINSVEMLEYAWNNVHFFDVAYIPQVELYVRFILDGIDVKKHKDRDSVVDARKLYVSFMDKDFNVVGEFPLKEKRYSNFHGWCVFPQGIIVYVDNLLGEAQDNLVFDIITPMP